MLWQIPVCAATDEERTRKSNMLHAQLETSLLRKNILPEKVINAGPVVFNIGFQDISCQRDRNFQGGSGFFMFDTRTSFTAYHAMEFLLNNISDWNEVVFKDQTRNQKEFKIKGVNFVSRLGDIAVLEVEGYQGPVLEVSTESPREQFYIIGYPKTEFEIQSVRTFEATDIYYGAFMELFDCYYGFNTNGASGGLLVNRAGKVEGVFSSKITSSFSTCDFRLIGKLHLLIAEMKTTETYDSIEEVKRLIHFETMKVVRLAVEGDMNARFELLNERPVSITEAFQSNNPLIKHTLMSVSTNKAMELQLIEPFNDIFSKRKVSE